jgi:glycosyltransferase involved in cell wall biosynthesis
MNQSKQKVSVLIPAYNASKFIDECIQSALQQTWDNIEVIVVDDGSHDDTYERACKYEPSVKVFRQKNSGASAARNRCFQECSGDFIQYLDADDKMANDKITNQMQLALTHGSSFIYSGRWAVFFSDEKDAVFRPTLLWRNFDNPVDWLITAWTNQIWMHPSSWLTPRQIIEQAGPWDESLSLHDDGEFFSRVLLTSKGIYFSNEAQSYYRKGIEDSLSGRLSKDAVLSHYKICELYEHHLLKHKDTPETRSACAANYMAFYYAHFPGNSEIRNRAKDSATRLGGTTLSAQGTELFHSLKKIVGWRAAKRLENFYYRNGLNRASIKNKLNKLRGRG